MNEADTLLKDEFADARSGGSRQRHPREKKVAIARECIESGASLASVALRHGLNANMLRKWVVGYRDGSLTATQSKPEFLPVVVDDTKPSPVERFKVAEGSRRKADRSIEVVLANGVIRLPVDVDATTLRLLVQALANR